MTHLFSNKELYIIQSNILYYQYDNEREMLNMLDAFLEYRSYFYWMCWIKQTIHKKDLWNDVYIRTIITSKWQTFIEQNPTIINTASFGINNLTFSLHRKKIVQFLLHLKPVQ